MPSLTVGELARHVGAQLEGDPEREIRGVAPLGAATADEVSFLERESLREKAIEHPPGALLLRPGVVLETGPTALLRVAHPQAAFAVLIRLFHPEPAPEPGIHPSAIVGRGVDLGAGVRLGPHTVVEAGARIGDGTVIGSGALIGSDVSIGRDARIGHAASILPGVLLGDRVVVHEGARIGTEGYGFSATPEGIVKIPQVGLCLIGDDVEIGANCTIDRGALGDTVIGARTKLDNLVHVAHNVRIGEDCMIVAQVGIAGSSTVGDGVSLAGQAGISGHCSIGAGARIAAQAGVIGDVPAGATYSGYPARPHRQMLRASAATLKLPAALERLRALERRVVTKHDTARADGGSVGESGRK